MRNVPLAVLFLVALSPACKPSPTKDSAPSRTETTKAVVPATGAVGKGLSAAENDPDAVALVREVLATSKKHGSLDTDSHAFKRWIATTRIRSDATTINLLEDPDAVVREVGSYALADDAARAPGSPSYRTDRALAGRLIAATGNQTDGETALRVGRHVGRIDLAKTDQLEAVRALVEKSRPSVVDGVLFSLLVDNGSHRPAYDFVMTLTKSPDPAVRESAVKAFWMGGGLSEPETCAMWAAHLDDPAPSVAAHSGELLAKYRFSKCSRHYDALLSSMTARIGATQEMTDPQFVWGIRELCKQKESTAPQRSRGGALARQLASGKQRKTSIRAAALDAVMACEGAAGVAFVTLYASDAKNPELAERARKLLAAK